MPSSRRENSSIALVPMDAVTQRIGQELAALSKAMQDLQGLISPLLVEAAARNPQHLHELQDLDHVAQKLGNLGDFVTTLATHVPGHWHVDPTAASQVVTLSDLSSRLTFTNDSSSATDHMAGDCEIF